MTEIMKVAGLCIHLMWLIQSVNMMLKKGHPAVFQYLSIWSLYEA